MGVRVYASQNGIARYVTERVAKGRMPASRWDYHRFEVGRLRGASRLTVLSAVTRRRESEYELD